MSDPTPGPWLFTDLGDIVAECQDDTDDPLASVHDLHGSKTSKDIEEGRANGRLMAAAPEMYAALTAALATGRLDAITIEKCLDALCKADEG